MNLRRHLAALGPSWTHWTVLPLVLWPAYVVFVRGEVRWEFLAMMPLVLALAFTGPRTRKLFVGLFPLALVAVLYDAMRFVKNVGISPGSIHVCDLRDHELTLFGVGSGASRVTLQDYFLVHHWNWVDLYCAIPYGTFIFVSMAFAVFLYFRSFVALQRYGWTFFGMNLAAFITYHVYPAAPPWYYHLTRSCVADLATHANAGSHLLNVDKILGISYFQSFYSRSADVFGAVPSLHVAYPLLILVEGYALFGPVRRALALLFTLSMGFAAVYLDHHYVIDVLLGVFYALSIDLVARAVFNRVGRDGTAERAGFAPVERRRRPRVRADVTVALPEASPGTGPRTARIRLAYVLATWFGCGYVPYAPGTAGTLGAVPLYLVLRGLGGGVVLAVAAALTAIGIWAADVVAKDRGLKDPQLVVIDEVAGVLCTLAFAPLTWPGLVTGVVLFRIFDQWKPWPARAAERKLPGGWGIVLDDIAAGAWGAIILVLLRSRHIL